MNITKYLLSAMLFSTLSGCVVIAKTSTANVHIQKELSISSVDIVKLNIDAGAGNMKITGSDTATEISLKADIYTTKAKDGDFELSLDKSRKNAFLVSKINTSGFWRGNSPRIDLVVIVPQQLLLDITDGSGDLWVKGIDGSIELDDASGDAYLLQIGNNLSIKDGSGALTISSVQGKLDIDDASGDLNISKIYDDVIIEDGSGELVVDDINGKLSIIDASGDVKVSNVIGDVDINDGSGELEVGQIKGTVIIDDASGDMLVKDVTGQVTVNDGSGDIHIINASGLSITEAGSGDLKVQQMKGSFEIGS